MTGRLVGNHSNILRLIMVRKTKAQAEVTRNAILDAAERLFEVQGLSRTSLQDIASAAGVTRGAIYWHFRDKRELFDSLMERALLPFESAIILLGSQTSEPVAVRLREHAIYLFKSMLVDGRLRRFFEITAHKIEYLDEIMAVRERLINVRVRHVEMLKQHLLLAALPEANCQIHALGLHVVMDGLIHNWMLDTSAFDLVEVGQSIVDTYLCGLQGSKMQGSIEEPMIS